MILAGSCLAFLIGGIVGLLGGGGTALMVPLLLYGFGMAPHEAIAGSLVVVAATSAVGALVHARSGAVDLRAAAIFGGASLGAAYLGGRAAELVAAEVLVALFAAAMLASAGRMLAGACTEAPPPPRPPLVLALAGVAVGGFCGLVGTGGGFLAVPTLILVGGVPVHRAVGTSLVVISAQAIAGAAGHLTHTHVDGRLLLGLAALSAAGAALGALGAPRLAAHQLRRGFALLLVGVSALFLHRQLPVGAASWSAVTAVVVLGAVAWWRSRPRPAPLPA